MARNTSEEVSAYVAARIHWFPLVPSTIFMPVNNTFLFCPDFFLSFRELYLFRVFGTKQHNFSSFTWLYCNHIKSSGPTANTSGKLHFLWSSGHQAVSRKRRQKDMLEGCGGTSSSPIAKGWADTTGEIPFSTSLLVVTFTRFSCIW